MPSPVPQDDILAIDIFAVDEVVDVNGIAIRSASRATVVDLVRVISEEPGIRDCPRIGHSVDDLRKHHVAPVRRFVSNSPERSREYASIARRFANRCPGSGLPWRPEGGDIDVMRGIGAGPGDVGLPTKRDQAEPGDARVVEGSLYRRVEPRSGVTQAIETMGGSRPVQTSSKALCLASPGCILLLSPSVTLFVKATPSADSMTLRL